MTKTFVRKGLPFLRRGYALSVDRACPFQRKAMPVRLKVFTISEKGLDLSVERARDSLERD